MYPTGEFMNGSWSNTSAFNKDLGPVYPTVIRTYAPNDLSTGACYGTSWTAINYTELAHPAPDYIAITECANVPNEGPVTKGEIVDSQYYLQGFPLLSLPADLSLIDPLWGTCKAAVKYGGYDPPRVLTPVVALDPGPTPTLDPVKDPKPASSPTHGLPTSTLVFGTRPSNTPSNPDSGGKGQPGSVSPPEGQESQGSGPSSHEDPDQGTAVANSDPLIFGTTSAADPGKATLVVGSHTVVVDESGASVDGVQLGPGGSPVTVSGAAASLRDNNVIIGDAIVHVSLAAEDRSTVVAGHTVKPLAGAVAVDGQILHAGDPARTIDGTLMSFDDKANIVINPTVKPLPALSTSDVVPLAKGDNAVIEGQAFKILNNGISIAGTIVTEGGPAVTLSGIPISLGSALLYIGSSAIPIVSSGSDPLITTIGDQVITAAPSSVVVQGTTLLAGNAGMMLDSEFISLNTAGSLVIGSDAIPLAGATLTTQLGDRLITASPDFVHIAGNTLLPGASAWMINGTSISLDTVGDIIIGSETIPLEAMSMGIGDLILAGFGSNDVTTTGSALDSSIGDQATRVSKNENGSTATGITNYYTSTGYWSLRCEPWKVGRLPIMVMVAIMLC